ncbi:MAG TPA: alkaline phosphatase D family protein [Solirubrobacteraceae bacterium]|nr:alkaline phosphatase D family protein [Solirubrobacteraceae bacterium]
MPELILGPLLRYIDEHDATVWVETDGACEVEVLGRRAHTFHVSGHHYALVAIEGLTPGETVEYEVALDGVRRWPEPGGGMPPSRLVPLAPERGLRLAFGSCRVAAPHEAPWVLERREDKEGRGVDALGALAQRMAGQRPEEWPSMLLMIGDQVYADDASPQTRAFIRSRRSTLEPPGEDVADFQEYARLYRESWSDPLIRWLLSTLPSAMIFDDHEVIDDWNTSLSWKRELARQPWWPDRIAGAFMSYWLYQHLGNLSPAELREDRLLGEVCAAEDAGPLLREFGLQSDATTAGTRWSYRRRLGASQLVVIDSRAGRLLSDERREMVDDEEWRWIDEHLHGDLDHLLIVTSLPYLLPRAIHDLEAWNEAVCAGAWGARAARWGERLRRAVDLEHWAAFRSSFDRLAGVLRQVAAGERGRPPASIVLLSGDVHYAYLAEAHLPGRPSQTRIYQAVCSPFRHGLGPPMELANRLSFHRVMEWGGELLRRLARLPKPSISWQMRHGPFFENEVATLELHGRQALVRLERTPPREMRLDCVDETLLT